MAHWEVKVEGEYEALKGRREELIAEGRYKGRLKKEIEREIERCRKFLNL